LISYLKGLLRTGEGKRMLAGKQEQVRESLGTVSYRNKNLSFLPPAVKKKIRVSK
jgi:hypothetical protein